MARTPTGRPVHIRRAPHRRPRLQPTRPRPGTPVGTSHCARPDAMTTRTDPQNGGGRDASIDLYWLPLGAGDQSRCVRGNGLAYEALVAAHQHRPRADLYHSALTIRLDGHSHAIEMAPIWAVRTPDRGVVAEGPVGVRSWGRARLLPLRDSLLARRHHSRRGCGRRQPPPGQQRHGQGSTGARPGRRFPTATWGRDEQRTGEMWNSNSLTAWLLALSGHDTDTLRPPSGGRAPGWAAGLTVAARGAITVIGEGPEVATR